MFSLRNITLLCLFFFFFQKIIASTWDGCLYPNLCRKMQLIPRLVQSWQSPVGMALRMLVKFGVAVYTIVTLVTTWNNISSSKLQLSLSQPSQYCVPFFDTVANLVSGPVPTRAAYDYVNGVAVVRLCTNFSNAQLDKLLDGQSSRYDPISAIGCPLNDAAIYSAVNQTCTSDRRLPCSDIIDLAPKPTGYDWAYDVTLVGNPCKVYFSFLDPPLFRCNYSLVASYRKSQPYAINATFATIFIPIGVTVLQLLSFAAYLCTKRDVYLAYVGEGLIAPFVFVFDRFWRGRNWPSDLDDHMPIVAQALLVLQGLAEGLICPVVATYGCGLSRYPQQLALLVVKLLVVAYYLVLFQVVPRLCAGKGANPLTSKDVASSVSQQDPQRVRLPPTTSAYGLSSLPHELWQWQWVLDAHSNLYWAEELQLHYCPESGMFRDPNNMVWSSAATALKPRHAVETSHAPFQQAKVRSL